MRKGKKGIRMAEKGLTKRNLEQIFTGFEKRQDKGLKGIEERVDLKLKALEERVVNQFHMISEGLVDQIKLLAEGHAGIIERLNLMEKENEQQHLEPVLL
jgi:acetyl-CoA carboxylase carboxyltransferase component